MRRAIIGCWVLALLFAAAVPAWQPSATAEARRLDFGETVIEIETDARTHRMRVQLATTPAQMARGLMYRRELAPWDGMLFDYRVPQPAQFWMKNTFIPLDILFVRADGRIESIGEGVPESTAIVGSDGPVRAVLELKRGTAARLGIEPGDRVRHRIFGTPVRTRP